MANRTGHSFAQVPKAEIQRSSFDRSHGIKTTMDAGALYPIYVDEALPGDTFNLKMAAFGRMATPITPIMDNIYFETFFFAVPNRLIWDNWERFNGAQDSPGDSIDYVIPQTPAPAGGFPPGSMEDYFGIPTNVDNISISSLFSRAYYQIWNDWFRDENLQPSLNFSKGDGPDPAPSNLRRRGKRHDYFTSCLPWPAKDNGNPVLLPLGTTAPITGIDGDPPTFQIPGGGQNLGLIPSAGNNWTFGGPDTSLGPSEWNNTGLEADLSNATSATINEIRQAFQVQRLQERDARGGTRYVEILKAHFGVSAPDFRLQRAELLSTGRTMVNINPVGQTTPTDIVPGVTPLGTLGAYGTFSMNGHGFTKSFVEHMTIIGLGVFRADLNYQQGINRMFTRKTRYDFYWGALSHIGEQAVTNVEIYAQGTSEDDEVFGYQERYAEYRYKPSIITGGFRSNSVAPLDFWHLAQDFANLPVLGEAFIADNPPMERILAVTDGPDFLFDGHITLRTARPMPLYGVPGWVDHF